MNRFTAAEQKFERAAHRARQGRRLRVESLERRDLLSGEPRLINVNPQPGPVGSDIRDFVVVGGAVYFFANDRATGRELWKSDGTQAGTVRVKDIRAGSDNSDPQSAVNVLGTLYFSANDGTAGFELWKTDGTQAGTVRITDIASGDNGSYPDLLTNVGGMLLLSGRRRPAWP